MALGDTTEIPDVRRLSRGLDNPRSCNEAMLEDIEYIKYSEKHGLLLIG
jgi:hypothetical protein